MYYLITVATVLLVPSACSGLNERKQRLTTGHPIFDIEDQESIVHGMDRGAKERIDITFPGTRWCGPGNTAEDYDDLGKYKETDKCCRDHDHCDALAAGEEKYGLVNDDWFTRLHCDCDKVFYQCLHSSNNTVSNVIGRQYFFFRDKCYKEAHPIVECVEYQSRIFIRRCIQYRFDKTQPKLYQWFDLPLYDIQQFPDNVNEVTYYEQVKQHQQQINMNLDDNNNLNFNF